MKEEIGEEAIKQLFGSEPTYNGLDEVQYYLQAYLLSLNGLSNREISEMMSEEGLNVSHTTVNKLISKGKTAYKGLHILIGMIGKQLKAQNSPIPQEYIIKALLIDGGVPQKNLEAAWNEYLSLNGHKSTVREAENDG